MSLNSGTFRMVFEDALYTFGRILFLYITIPLFILWIAIAYYFNLGEDVVAAISGPAYFMIPIFAISGFKSMFPVAIGMGSTRINFLKTLCLVGLISVIIVTLVLNIFQGLLVSIFERLDITSSILHPAAFLGHEYSFGVYFLLDFMFMTFLFSLAFLLYTVYYRLGFKRSIICLMVLTVLTTLINYSGIMNFSLSEWMGSVNDMALFAFILILSIMMLFLTYPIMINAPLHPKSKKD